MQKGVVVMGFDLEKFFHDLRVFLEELFEVVKGWFA